MPPIGRAAIGIALGIVFGACASTAAICHLIASNSPRSEVARRLIAQEHEEFDGKYFPIEPDDDLLSARGVALRARARRFGKAALVCAALIFVWAAWAN